MLMTKKTDAKNTSKHMFVYIYIYIYWYVLVCMSFASRVFMYVCLFLVLLIWDPEGLS